MPDPVTISTIHISATAVMGAALVIGGPLLGYIVKLKDREVRELWAKLDAFKSASEHRDRDAEAQREAIRSHCHDLDLKAAKLGGEVKVATELKDSIRDIAKKVDRLTSEVADLRGAMRGTPRPPSRSSPRNASDPPERRR